MDRASDSGSEGWGFESLPVYQKREDTIWYPLFFRPPGGKGLEDINAARVEARRIERQQGVFSKGDLTFLGFKLMTICACYDTII